MVSTLDRDLFLWSLNLPGDVDTKQIVINSNGNEHCGNTLEYREGLYHGYDLQGNGSGKVFLIKWYSSKNLKDEQRFRRSGCLSREDSRWVDKEQSEW